METGQNAAYWQGLRTVQGRFESEPELAPHFDVLAFATRPADAGDIDGYWAWLATAPVADILAWLDEIEQSGR